MFPDEHRFSSPIRPLSIVANAAFFNRCWLAA